MLGEACWHLGGNTQPVHALLGLVRVGAIQLIHPWPGHLERTQELMMKYDRMDAADASLVMLSEIHRKAKIITTDRRDFPIYRRFGRHRLPVILPPARPRLWLNLQRDYEYIRADHGEGEAIRETVHPCAT